MCSLKTRTVNLIVAFYFLLFFITILFAAYGCRSATSAGSDKILLEESVYIFEDGETVSIWQFPNDSKLLYLLSDGTELMATTVSGPGSLDQLPQATQDSISKFYAQNGTEYNIEEYLEKAYVEYTSLEDKSSFRCYYLQQDTFESGTNEQVVYCTTSLLLPLGQGDYEQYYITRAFDKESGASISGWDLFYGTKDEIVSSLLFDYSNQITDPDALIGLYEDFKPEYVRFYPDRYNIVFPAKTSLHIGRDPISIINITGEYTEKVLSVLHGWAIPN